MLIETAELGDAHFPALNPGETLAIGRDGDLADGVDGLARCGGNSSGSEACGRRQEDDRAEKEGKEFAASTRGRDRHGEIVQQ